MLEIRIRIRMFLGLLDPDPDPLVRGRVSDPHWFNADPDTDPDPATQINADPKPWSEVWIRIRLPIRILPFSVKSVDGQK